MSTSIKWATSARRMATTSQKVSVKFMNFPPKVVENSLRIFYWRPARRNWIPFLPTSSVKSRRNSLEKDEPKVKKLLHQTCLHRPSTTIPCWDRQHATNRRNDLNSETKSMLPCLIIFSRFNNSAVRPSGAGWLSPDEPVAACLKFNNKFQRLEKGSTHTRGNDERPAIFLECRRIMSRTMERKKKGNNQPNRWNLA